MSISWLQFSIEPEVMASKSLTKGLKLLAALGALLLTAGLLLHTGLARRAFFELFAYVKGVEVLGPTIVREFPADSPYENWLKQARLDVPMLEGLMIDDIERVALRPWPKLGEGITGLYLRFADYQMTDGRIVEIPAAGHTASQRHLYEQGIYLVTGSGYSVLQQEGVPDRRIEWQQGDLFAVPLNVRFGHYNTGREPARMLVVTSFPLMLNVMNSEEFLEQNSFVFSDRYDGAADYFGRVENADKFTHSKNFVDDILHARTQRDDYRGVGNESIRWLMAGNSMLSLHVSQIPPRRYAKAHRHSSDAFILLLSGEGFSVAWPEGAYHDRVRVDWKAGTLFVPPVYWYHQHLNTSTIPARYLAINVPAFVRNIGLRFTDQLEVDNKAVRAEWDRELEKAAREQ